MIVLDTNVLSEILKPSPAVAVERWLVAQEPSDVFTTTITQAEMLYGLETLAAGKRRNDLNATIEKVLSEDFYGRILSFDEESARAFAQIAVACKKLGRPITQFDAMIAGICRWHRATIATRNVRDFEHCGISVVNPWDYRSPIHRG